MNWPWVKVSPSKTGEFSDPKIMESVCANGSSYLAPGQDYLGFRSEDTGFWVFKSTS